MLGVASFLVLAALGPGLYNSSATLINTWQFNVFHLLCHQDPARSFTISGVQMAVCTRCLGIYVMFMMGSLMIPVFAFLKPYLNISEKRWLIVAILLNLTDVLGNYFELWTNTLISRFLLGSFLGLMLALILTNEYFTIKKPE